MQYQTDAQYANKNFNNEGPIIKNIIQLQDPLETALSLVRRLLGAPKDTKIMLAVDELSKASNPKGKYAQSLMMSDLCHSMDADLSLYLSISAYGCVDVQRMVTGSTRRLLLQPLPPILPLYGNNYDKISLLPFVLRPFFAEEMRVLLPCSRDDLSVYWRISELFHTAGAHPRRLQYLFSKLSEANSKFEFVLDGLKNKSAVDFSRELEGWLNESTKAYIIKAISGECAFSYDHRDLSGSDMKQFAKDVVVPFEFPKDAKNAEKHNVMLGGSVSGFCSYLPQLPDSLKGFAYIPPPVLDEISNQSYEEPEADALALLSEALFCNRYCPIWGAKLPGKQTKIEKALEEVALYSLLLYARCNENFSPNTFCYGNECGSGLELRLRSGSSVEVWKDIVQIPYNESVQSADGRLQRARQLFSKYVYRLERKPGCSGALFQLSDTGNMGGDVYGLFRSAASDEYVLLVVQCKDWFGRRHHTDVTSTSDDELRAEWNKSKSVFPDKVIHLKKKNFSTKNVVVRVLHLLMTSNDLPKMLSPIEKNRGIITFQSMRYWIPPAAYALECTRELRKLFYQLPQTMLATKEPRSK